MGLISDRKNKKKEQYKNSFNVVNTGSLGSFHPSSYHHGGPAPHGVIPTQHGSRGSNKKGIFGTKVLPAPPMNPHHPHHHPQGLHHGGYGSGGGSGVHSRSGRGGSATSLHHPMPPGHQGQASGVQKYPAGYYTTPVHHTSGNASWSHPSQPRGYNPNVNPRYQTWVAP